MADTHESIDDIIAEISGYRDPVVRERRLDVRLKAAIAHERKATAEKSSVVGDCAKLREALELCMDEMCSRCRDLAAARSNSLPCLQGCEPVRKAKAALAAPPRNRDALSAQEQTEKFNQFCQSHRNSDLPKCAGCPLEDIPGGTGCAFAWAQMPYESEAAK